MKKKQKVVEDDTSIVQFEFDRKVPVSFSICPGAPSMHKDDVVLGTCDCGPCRENAKRPELPPARCSNAGIVIDSTLPRTETGGYTGDGTYLRSIGQGHLIPKEFCNGTL